MSKNNNYNKKSKIMKTITRKELKEWKKQFHVGDKVKVTYEGEFYGMEGVVTRKNSYVYVKL
jgi:hypothetical protein